MFTRVNDSFVWPMGFNFLGGCSDFPPKRCCPIGSVLPLGRVLFNVFSTYLKHKYLKKNKKKTGDLRPILNIEPINHTFHVTFYISTFSVNSVFPLTRGLACLNRFKGSLFPCSNLSRPLEIS